MTVVLDATLRIGVVGEFQLTNRAGQDVAPRSRKACALIALIALAPNHRRTRVWLQDKLWSTRGGEQAAGSLRQALSDIRRALGPDRDILIASNHDVRLDSAQIWIDVDHLPEILRALAPGCETPELLEGIDVGDEEFEDWLRERRQSLSARIADMLASVRPGKAAGPEPSPEPSPEESGELGKPYVLVSADSNEGDGLFVGNFVAERIARGIADCVSVNVMPHGGHPQQGTANVGLPGLQIRASVLPAGNQTMLRLGLLSAGNQELLWSVVRTIPERPELSFDHPIARQMHNQAIDVAMDILSRPRAQHTAATVANHLALDAVKRIFSLRADDLFAADRLLQQAQEADPRGIYNAWRAFLRTFLLGERYKVDTDVVRAKSEALIREALQAEPNNSNIYALAAHVNYFTLDNIDAAVMLARTSLDLNPANPLAHAHLGTASAIAGRHEEGHRHALTALEITGNGPHRFQIMMHCCLTAILTGRYREAIFFAESSRSLAPNFLPPIRHLAALYFHQGDHQKAAELLSRLRLHEPDFTVDLLRSEHYPADTLRRTPLIEIANSSLLI